MRGHVVHPGSQASITRCAPRIYICLLLCYPSHLKPCRCSGLGQDQFGNYHLSSTFDQLPGYLHLNRNLSSCGGWDKVWGGLGSYIGTYYPNVSFDDPGFFLTHYSMPISSGGGGSSSFSVLVTMSIYQSYNQSKPYSSLLFSIRPALDPELYEYPFPILDTTPFYSISGPSYTTVNVSSGNVYVTISDGFSGVVWVQIGIELPGPGGNSSGANNNYSVWIHYDDAEHGMLVYVGTGEGTSKPANPIANMTLSSCMPGKASLGFLSSVGQLIQLHTLNSTIVGHDNDTRNSTIFCYGLFYRPGHLIPYGPGKKTIVLSSVLGSAAATAATAAVAYLYYNSRQRR